MTENNTVAPDAGGVPPGGGEDLLEALKVCQSALAMLTEPQTIRSTTVHNAWATAVDAELKARAAIAKATNTLSNEIATLEGATTDRVSGELADVLVMTGSKDRAELEDMANIGRAFMERLDMVVTADGPFKGWAPADCPTELVTDMLNELEEAEAKIATLAKPAPSGEVREKVARIIDPAAWQGVYGTGLVTGFVADRQKAALTKADAILSLISQGGE